MTHSDAPLTIYYDREQFIVMIYEVKATRYFRWNDKIKKWERFWTWMHGVRPYAIGFPWLATPKSKWVTVDEEPHVLEPEAVIYLQHPGLT